MKLDIEKVCGRIKTKKISFGKLAEDLGMCRTTLWNKINGYSDFKLREIEKLVSILGNDIFLK